MIEDFKLQDNTSEEIAGGSDTPVEEESSEEKTDETKEDEEKTDESPEEEKTDEEGE